MSGITAWRRERPDIVASTNGVLMSTRVDGA